MSSVDFEYLIHFVGHRISKNGTNYRQAIPVKENLAKTLRFLSTGNSYHSLIYVFKVSKQSISVMVLEVCKVLIDVLKDYLKVIYL